MNFERGKDPKESMGIGIWNEIEKYLEDRGSENIFRDKKWLIALSIFIHENKIDYVDFLLDQHYVNIDYGDCSVLRICAFQGKYEMAVYLISKGADLESAIQHAKELNERITLRNLKKLLNHEI